MEENHENEMAPESKLLRDFVHGNRSDCIELLGKLEPVLAALLAARIALQLSGSDRESFLRFLELWAD
jgi:hypothetical protein